MRRFGRPLLTSNSVGSRNGPDLPPVFGPGVTRVGFGERVMPSVFACAAGAQPERKQHTLPRSLPGSCSPTSCAVERGCNPLAKPPSAPRLPVGSRISQSPGTRHVGKLGPPHGSLTSARVADNSRLKVPRAALCGACCLSLHSRRVHLQPSSHRASSRTMIRTLPLRVVCESIPQLPP
jgi:hypothetical protein